MKLAKDDKANFIQDFHSRYRDHCYGILQWERDWAQLQKQHLQAEFIAKVTNLRCNVLDIKNLGQNCLSE